MWTSGDSFVKKTNIFVKKSLDFMSLGGWLLPSDGDNVANIRQQKVGPEKCPEGSRRTKSGAPGAGQEGGDVHHASNQTQQASSTVSRETTWWNWFVHSASGKIIALVLTSLYVLFCFKLSVSHYTFLWMSWVSITHYAQNQPCSWHDSHVQLKVVTWLLTWRVSCHTEQIPMSSILFDWKKEN